MVSHGVSASNDDVGNLDQLPGDLYRLKILFIG